MKSKAANLLDKGMRLVGTLRSRRIPRLRRRWAVLLVTTIAIPLLIFASFQLAVRCMPYPDEWKKPPESGTFLLDRNGVPLASLVAADGQWHLPLADREVSRHLLNAIVAVEDARFFEHGGVDWRSAGGALLRNTRALHIRRGASTITMQLQRLRDPRPRTFGAKLDQAIRASQIERAASKRDILIEYVNRAPFGGNLVGAGAASYRYFGKPCAILSLAEAALLAGVPQNPAHLRPDRFPVAATKRRNHVLDRMLACGMITAREHNEARAETIDARWNPLPQDRAASDTAAADGAMPALIKLSSRYPAQTVKTTIDATVQKTIYALSHDALAQLRGGGVCAAAIVVLDSTTSRCLAVASLGDASTVGMVDLTTRPRSTGSTLKPFIYAAAFEAGVCGPKTLLDDSPAAWPGYEPADYDRTFRGPIPAAEALALSRNIPALLVLQHVGIARAVGLMQSAGLQSLGKTPDRYGLSLAIGGAEATPMELAAAYAMLARGGTTRDVTFTVEPHDKASQKFDASELNTLTRPNAVTPAGTAVVPPPGNSAVSQRGGSLELRASTGLLKTPPPYPSPAGTRERGPEETATYSSLPGKSAAPSKSDRVKSAHAPIESKPFPECVEERFERGSAPAEPSHFRNAVSLPPAVCWEILSALSDPERTRRVCPEATRTHAAWKTGTSSGHRDAWCAAVTERHVVVVWLGNPSGAGSPILVGQEAAAPLALRIVGALDSAGCREWPVAKPPQNPPARLVVSQSPFVNGSPLTLVSPAPEQTFVIDPDVAPAGQRISLRASSRTGQTLWWFVDDEALPSQRTGADTWWEPKRGDHDVRVVDAAGQSASTHFHVVGP